MKHLYEITQDLQELQAMLDNDDYSIDDLADQMELLEMDFSEKISNSIKLIKQIQHDAHACKVEGNRLLDRSKRLDKRLTWLTDYVTTQMVRAGRPKLQFPEFNVTVRTAVRTVFITHEESLPDQFTSIIKAVKVDKKAIADAIRSGESVPGTELLDGKKWLDIR